VKNFFTPRVCLTALGVGLLVLVVGVLNRLTGTRIVALETLPNGVEIMVKQKFTWSGDLFNTSFQYRSPGGEWLSRYYSHEDSYWGRGRVTLDPTSHTATIERDGVATIAFNWGHSGSHAVHGHPGRNSKAIYRAGRSLGCCAAAA